MAPLLWLLLSLLVSAEGNQEGGGGGRVIRCNAGDYELGSPAAVTCIFPQDVGEQGVSVVHNPASGRDRTEVLQCLWSKEEKRYRCQVTTGYHFDLNVTDRLTVRINETRENQAGSYVCHVIPPRDTQVETCTLNLTERSEVVTDPPKRSTPAEGKSNMAATTDAAQPLGSVLVIVIIVLVLLVCLIVGVAVGFCIIIRKLNELRPAYTSVPGAEPEPHRAGVAIDMSDLVTAGDNVEGVRPVKGTDSENGQAV